MKVIGETMFTFLPHPLPSAVDLPCSPRLEVITSGIAQMTWLGAPMAKDPESLPVLTIIFYVRRNSLGPPPPVLWERRLLRRIGHC